jgi:hypothetical protein
MALRSPPRDDPNRVHDPGDVAEQGEQDVEPEVQPETDLEKDPERGQQNGQQNANQIHEALRKNALRRTAPANQDSKRWAGALVPASRIALSGVAAAIGEPGARLMPH